MAPVLVHNWPVMMVLVHNGDGVRGGGCTYVMVIVVCGGDCVQANTDSAHSLHSLFNNYIILY